MQDGKKDNQFQAKFRSWITNIEEASEGWRISDRIEEDKFESNNQLWRPKGDEVEFKRYWGYNIKKITKSKTVNCIDEMIQDELGLSDESVRQWDRFVSMFSSINFGDQITGSIEAAQN